MNELLNSKNVLENIYSYFEKKSNKEFFNDKITTLYKTSSYVCDFDGHSPTSEYVHYNEYLKINNNNLMIKGQINNDNLFLRIMPLFEKERIENILKNYSLDKNNFFNNIVLMNFENVSICPVINNVLSLNSLRTIVNVVMPDYEKIVEKYYNKLFIKKNILNSYIIKLNDKSEKYFPKIVDFLANELEKLLK